MEDVEVRAAQCQSAINGLSHVCETTVSCIRQTMVVRAGDLLQNRAALITGATSGIGRAIAMAFAVRHPPHQYLAASISLEL